jgi:membrane dipeptidase
MYSINFPFSHNDLPWNIRKFIHNKLHLVNLTTDLRMVKPWSDSVWSHTDLHRMSQGNVGGQVSLPNEMSLVK